MGSYKLNVNLFAIVRLNSSISRQKLSKSVFFSKFYPLAVVCSNKDILYNQAQPSFFIGPTTHSLNSSQLAKMKKSIPDMSLP